MQFCGAIVRKAYRSYPLSHDLQVPARAQLILEGFVLSNETAEAGSLGDHSY